MNIKSFDDLLFCTGKKLRMLREATGLSQEEVSFRANIHRTQMSRLENGENNLCLKTLYQLLSFYEVDLHTFFDFSDLKE